MTPVQCEIVIPVAMVMGATIDQGHADPVLSNHISFGNCPVQVLALVATVCAAVTISNLDFPDLSDIDNPITRSVENTRTQTRVACVFIILVTVATVALQALLIIITLLNFGFAQRYSMVVLLCVSLVTPMQL